MTLLLRFGEFILCFLQLLLEGRVGMQGRHHRRADYPRRIDVALPMIAADNPAMSWAKAGLSANDSRR